MMLLMYSFILVNLCFNLKVLLQHLNSFIANGIENWKHITFTANAIKAWFYFLEFFHQVQICQHFYVLRISLI